MEHQYGRRALDKPRHAPGWPRSDTRIDRNVLTGLRAGWPLLVVLPLLLGAATYLVSARSDDVYQASARVFLDAGVLSANGADPVRGVLTQSALAVSPAALSAAGNRLGISEAAVHDNVTTAPSPSANFFTVTGSAGTPQAAVALVAATEGAYETLVTSQLGGPGSTLVDTLANDQVAAQRALADASAAAAASPGNALLKARVAVLRAQLRALGVRQNDALSAAYAGADPVQLLETPVSPSSPVSPRPNRNALVALLAGVALAVALLWWRSDRFATIRTSDVFASTSLSRLATLPRLSRKARRHPLAAGSARARSLAEAALAVDTAVADGSRALLLVGCRRGDLSPQTVLGLAHAFAVDRRVVLVDGDQEQQELTRALSAVGVRTSGPTRRLNSGLVALPAQTATGDCVFVPAQPAPGQHWRHHHDSLTAELRASFDLVIVSGPPPEESPIAGLAAASTDVTVLIVGPATPISQIVATCARLADLGRPVLGYVLDGDASAGAAGRRQRQSVGLGWQSGRADGVGASIDHGAVGARRL